MPQPEKKLDPAQSPQAWFGCELRYWRKQEGLSARQLGHLVQVSDDVILAVEKGRYPSCQQALALQLDSVLDTGGVFARAWPMAFGSDADKKRADADKQPERPVNDPKLVTEGRILSRDTSAPLTGSPVPVDRRSFLQASGLAALVPVGLTHAEKGLVRSDRLTATERAMLHTARARAFAKMKDVQNTLAAVGQADDAFADRNTAEDPLWMAYYDEAQHAGDTAHALFDLAVLAGQDPGRAGQRFALAVQGHDPAFRRSRAISRTKLAALTMAKGDPRQAARIGHDALDEVGRLTSRRAVDDLQQLGRFAGAHSKVQDAMDLRERIAATVRA
jgi:DNA-binding XRE family transcriptional regulator